jgi:hypothetical protein
LQKSDYCREIEAHLCRKNEGHLIRIVGPSFDLVSQWAADGVPLKVAFRGIDRSVERYYRKGPRRRPVRIEFCDADVRDVFDEWRRALGLTTAAPEDVPSPERQKRSISLRAHLDRVLMRLSSARATGALPPEADALVDRVAREVEADHASASGIRGPERRALLERLAALDAELLTIARDSLQQAERRDVERQAEEQLAAFRAQMAPAAYAAARSAAIDQLARERLNLPTIAYA